MAQKKIDSIYVEAPFNSAKRRLNENNYKVISLEENALLRMQEGRKEFVSRWGNYTREGFVYVPRKEVLKEVFLVKNSPVLQYPQKATLAHYDGKEFYPTKEQIEKALEDSVRIPFNQKPIPTNRFGDEEITAFAYCVQAKTYGEFLDDAGIKKMPIWLLSKDYVPKQEKPFVRQLWLCDLGCKSGLLGCNKDLAYFIRVRGIRKNLEETLTK